jgi:GT2 family glycosyltransferase
MPAVSVVIPNWNGVELLKSISLPSLAVQTFSDFSITVVDNGSIDESAAYLRSAWPDISVIEVSENSGFAAAVNRGITSTDAEFVALMNNDIELEAKWLEEMVSAARQFPAAGSLACRILDFDDRTLITTVGDCISTAGSIFWRGWRERDIGQYNTLEPVFSACAGAALYRREAFGTVGLFDETFFAYLEDVDWGFRAQLAGFPCWYVPSAVAYHVGGATSSKVSGMRAALLARNAYWLVLKNFPSGVAARHAPALAFVLARRFYRAFRDGHRKRTGDALLRAACMTPAMARKRRQIQSTRRIGDEQLVSILANDVSLGSRKLERLQSLLSRPASFLSD